MRIECVILGLFVPYNFSKTFCGTSLNIIYTYDIFSLVKMLILAKVYVVIRIYTYFSPSTSITAYAVCNTYKIIKGIVFAIKAD